MMSEICLFLREAGCGESDQVDTVGGVSTEEIGEKSYI